MDSTKARIDPPERPASQYAAAVGIFFLVNFVVIIGLSFFTPADAGALSGFLGLVVGGIAVWWYQSVYSSPPSGGGTAQ